jgi:hypothetical protein
MNQWESIMEVVKETVGHSPDCMGVMVITVSTDGTVVTNFTAVEGLREDVMILAALEGLKNRAVMMSDEEKAAKREAIQSHKVKAKRKGRS